MPTPITKKGFEALKAELDRLRKVERPKNIEAIAEARAHGDLSENAEYDAAKERQGQVEATIADIDRWALVSLMVGGETEVDRTRAAIDLAFVSVLLDAGAGLVIKPAVIGATQATFVGNAVLHVDEAMQAAFADEAELAGRRAVEREVLAHQAHALDGLFVEFDGDADRLPVSAQQLAHGRAGTGSHQEFVFFVGQHVCLLHPMAWLC